MKKKTYVEPKLNNSMANITVPNIRKRNRTLFSGEQVRADSSSISDDDDEEKFWKQ